VDSQTLLTVSEAAQRLERSTEQVRRYLREGRLQGRRLGNQWFIDAATLDAFLHELREERGFLDKVRPATESDPLASVIGIGDSDGSNIAAGKAIYGTNTRWRG
jgi:excisionase family DNA binding protein